MMKTSAKRMLLTVAAASSLAAVMAPQAASAAEVRAQGRGQAQTSNLQSGADRTVRYQASAREANYRRTYGFYDLRNSYSGHRVRAGYFYGSTSGTAYVQRYNSYMLRVTSTPTAFVTAQLSN